MHADAIDVPALVRTLKDLGRGLSVDVPVYDFATHQRSDEVRHVEAADVVVVEGACSAGGLGMAHEPHVTRAQSRLVVCVLACRKGVASALTGESCTCCGVLRQACLPRAACTLACHRRLTMWAARQP